MQTSAQRYKLITAVLVAFIAICAVYILVRHIGDDDSLEPNFPPGGPAEFLYLDPARVRAYLAQVNGGTFDAEKITRKLSSSLNAKVGLSGSEGGGSEEKETSVEREVRPTDASNFFQLRAGLQKEGVLHEIGLLYYGSEDERDISQLNEGDFVTFQTTALLSPQYLNAYLAVRHEHTVSTLFPNSPQRRQQAKAFSETVGADPRVVFALKPREKVDSEVVEKPFVYLLPMDASNLTSERSLIKYGGGRFTVVGKLVRIFPELGREDSPAYVDSPTRETWEAPLRKAPRELLCRTDPKCVKAVRGKALPLAARRAAGQESRQRTTQTLSTQTEIDSRGAVILPLAIYK